jgi:1-acyl-sn-glycerol-3-phosphate acyltransferase
VKRDFYYWRLVATGFCFAAFGLGGFVIGVVVTPLLSLCISDRPRLHRIVRRLIHLSFRLFVGLMRGVGVLTYSIRGRERLDAPGELVIATHRTLIDVVFLVACIPNAVCVVKDGVFRSRALGALVRAAGYVNSGGDAELSLQRAIAALTTGATLVIFPEGTRSSDAAEPRLRRGAAYIAMATGKPLTPVRITCEPLTLTKSEHWYDIPPRRVHFDINVGARIGVDPAASAASKHVAARALTARVKDFFLEDAPLYE